MVRVRACVTYGLLLILPGAPDPIGIFPAGLGLREGLAAGLAVAIQVSPALAVAASTVERLSGLAGRALVVPILGLRLRHVARRHAPGEGTPASSTALDARAATDPETARTTGNPDGANG
jgi:hypothetical protein